MDGGRETESRECVCLCMEPVTGRLVGAMKKRRLQKKSHGTVLRDEGVALRLID